MESMENTATSLVGDLTSYTSQELASTLTNIDVSFTCKVCATKKTTLKELVDHLMGGKCSPTDVKAIKREDVGASAVEDTPVRDQPSAPDGAGDGIPKKRGRGRPPKSSKIVKVGGTSGTGVAVSKPKAPRIPVDLTPSRRVTRMSTGSIHRRNAAEMLGLNVKEELMDSEEVAGSANNCRADASRDVSSSQVGKPREAVSQSSEVMNPPTSMATAGASVAVEQDGDVGGQEGPTAVDQAMATTQAAVEEDDSDIVQGVLGALRNVATSDMARDEKGAPRQLRVIVVNQDPGTGKTTEEHIIISGVGAGEGAKDVDEEALMAVAKHVAKRVKASGSGANSGTRCPVTVKVATTATPVVLARGKESHARSPRVGGNESVSGGDGDDDLLDSKRRLDTSTDMPLVDDDMRDDGERNGSEGDADYKPQLKTFSLTSSSNRGAYTEHRRRGRPPKGKTSASYFTLRDGTIKEVGVRTKRPYRCPICLVRYFTTETEYTIHMECHVYQEDYFTAEDTPSQSENIQSYVNVAVSGPNGAQPGDDEGKVGTAGCSRASPEDTDQPGRDRTCTDDEQLAKSPNEAEESTDELAVAPSASHEPAETPMEQEPASVSTEQATAVSSPSYRSKIRKTWARKRQIGTYDETKRELFRCQKCPQQTVGWNRFLRHLVTHEEFKERLADSEMAKNIIGVFHCPVCRKAFGNKMNMKTHWKKVHHKLNRTCDICKACLVGVDDKTFVRHVEKCKNVAQTCPHCQYNTTITSNMRRHMKIHTGQGFTCAECGKVFPTRQRYEVHCLRHQTDRPRYPCEFCEQEFCSIDAAKKHMARMHSDNPTHFPCSMCNYVAKIQIDLTKHEKLVHNKKYRCGCCSFMSNSQSAYQQHQEYHAPDRVYKCPYTNCYYRASSTKQLSTHCSNVHYVHSKHQCPICQKFFKKKTHLLRHLVSHTGDKPYMCLECGMSFYSHSTYYRHRGKTGHDAKREGVVSVPQNIMITYVDEPTPEEKIPQAFSHQHVNSVEYIPAETGGIDNLLLQADEVVSAEQILQQEMIQTHHGVDPGGIEVETSTQSVHIQSDGSEVIFIETSEDQFLEEIAAGHGVHVTQGNNNQGIGRLGAISVTPASTTASFVTAVGESFPENLDMASVSSLGMDAGSQLHVISADPEGSALQQITLTDMTSIGAQQLPQHTAANIVSITDDGHVSSHVMSAEGQDVEGLSAAAGTSDGFGDVNLQESENGGDEYTYVLTADEAEALLNGQLPSSVEVKTDGARGDGSQPQAEQIAYRDPAGHGDIETVVEVAPPGNQKEQQYAILLMPPGRDEPEAALSMLQLSTQ